VHRRAEYDADRPAAALGRRLVAEVITATDQGYGGGEELVERDGVPPGIAEYDARAD